ncbi:transketolase-like protein 2 [Galleria mellonella]|uniref:transketolase n=1 Tax=Galleria mellonella TaxID=7137 RepID=A0A6J1X5I7_GALME|nr:transketolase-like protein 2 [Galleria mellonella]
MKGDKNVDIQALKDIANKLRIDSIVATNASKSGHPTSCASMAEIMSVLFFHTMKYKISAPKDPSADRFVLSKGHAAPILYAAWAEAGLFPVDELKNLRKLDSDLEGHPTPRLNFVDVGTGSLGQGLAVAAGMAYVGKYFDQTPYRVYCLVGDGEAAEGSIWESLHFASHYKLDNLVVIFDVNRLGQSEPTSLQHQLNVYDARLKAFGLHSLVVDGHDVSELVKAFDEAANTSGRPTAIVAKTFKGRGFPGIEDLDNWHGKALGAEGEKIIKVLQSQIKNNTVTLKPKPPTAEAPKVHIGDITLSSPPSYKPGEQVATRLAYGTALKKIADTNLRVIAMDGDTKNSTFSDKLRNAYPERYIECFIAEQNLVGVATGVACRDRAVVFASTFAAFFTRTFDQIRMGAISQSNINLAGSHCGVSIGEDGPSQMGLEDLALFRSVPTATVFYPSDAVSTERAVELAANTKGICYIRTSRPNTPILYPNDEQFKVGQAKIIRESPKDRVLLIGAGVTLHEAVAAADKLKAEGVEARVLDPFTIKPLDEEAVVKHARAVGGNVVVVEDHYQAGGVGEAVLSAVALVRDIAVKHVYVREVPRSGPPAVLLDKYGISAPHIVAAAKAVLKA